MYLMIDNYDSFVYNLAAYIRELGAEIRVVRADAISLKEVKSMKDLQGIILSPGPKRPQDGGICLDIVREMKGKIPILGVCLGHQIIAHVFGANVDRGQKPWHGKVTAVSNTGCNLFAGLPESYQVTRYHSLEVKPETLPQGFTIDAMSEDGSVMAISHSPYKLYGIQFHPEAVLTEYGHEILKNFLELCGREERAA